MTTDFAFTCSASIMCANLLRLEDDLKTLEEAGCEELHFDIMDGVFVPNITFGFDLIKAAKQVTKLPCNAHLMIVEPDRYIDRFVEAGCDSITVHVEACDHAHRTLAHIKEAGASPGIAINPGTPLTKIDYLLDSADRVLVMTVEPGYAGQAIVPSASERVKILRQNINHRELATLVEVDGNINVENAATLSLMGATNFVLGTSSIFQGTTLRDNLYQFKKAVAAQRHLI
jgi:ribulose-phosphate 3-epimerase